jgi:hypothetical protein
MYNLCINTNLCEFDGTTWSKDELVQLVNSVGIACDSSLGKENNFTVYDKKFDGFKSLIFRIWDEEGRTPLQDNVNDTAFRDKIIPFIRNVRFFRTLLLAI